MSSQTHAQELDDTQDCTFLITQLVRKGGESRVRVSQKTPALLSSYVNVQIYEVTRKNNTALSTFSDIENYMGRWGYSLVVQRLTGIHSAEFYAQH